MKKVTSRYLQTFMCATLLGISASQANAGLIAHYTFDDGTPSNIESAEYQLTETGANTFAGGSYSSDGDTSNFLSVEGPGGLPDFTVSLWAYTTVSDQGVFKGLFSNQDSPENDFSWQIDSSNGEYTLRSRQGSSNTSFTIGAVMQNTWQNIVLQKFGGNNAQVFLNGIAVGPTGYNPGGLQNFRLGINRNTDNAFSGLIDNIRIYNDSTQSASVLFAEGPGVNAVPTPATLALFGLGLAGLGYSRRKKA